MHTIHVNPIGNTGTGRQTLEGSALRPADAAKPNAGRVCAVRLMPTRLS
ncbi:hypothetical protein ACFWPQ_33905 [Streptomyces sp. NPDC058464]